MLVGYRYSSYTKSIPDPQCNPVEQQMQKYKFHSKLPALPYHL